MVRQYGLARVVLVVLVLLMYLAYDGSDARARSSADKGSFKTVTKDCAKRGSSGPANQGSLAGTDAALVLVSVVAVVVAIVISAIIVAGIVVLSASTTSTDTPVKLLVIAIVPTVATVPVLCASRKNAGGKQQRGDENQLADLHDVSWMRIRPAGCVRFQSCRSEGCFAITIPAERL